MFGKIRSRPSVGVLTDADPDDVERVARGRREAEQVVPDAEDVLLVLRTRVDVPEGGDVRGHDELGALDRERHRRDAVQVVDPGEVAAGGVGARHRHPQLAVAEVDAVGHVETEVVDLLEVARGADVHAVELAVDVAEREAVGLAELVARLRTAGERDEQLVGRAVGVVVARHHRVQAHLLAREDERQGGAGVEPDAPRTATARRADVDLVVDRVGEDRGQRIVVDDGDAVDDVGVRRAGVAREVGLRPDPVVVLRELDDLRTAGGRARRRRREHRVRVDHDEAHGGVLVHQVLTGELDLLHGAGLRVDEDQGVGRGAGQAEGGRAAGDQPAVTQALQTLGVAGEVGDGGHRLPRAEHAVVGESRRRHERGAEHQSHRERVQGPHLVFLPHASDELPSVKREDNSRFRCQSQVFLG